MIILGLLFIVSTTAQLGGYGSLCIVDAECGSNQCSQNQNPTFCCGDVGLLATGQCKVLAQPTGSCMLTKRDTSPNPGPAPIILGPSNALCQNSMCTGLSSNIPICANPTGFPFGIVPVTCNPAADNGYCAGAVNAVLPCSQIIQVPTTKVITCPSCLIGQTYCCTNENSVPCSTINPNFGGQCCQGFTVGQTCTANWQCGSGLCNIPTPGTSTSLFGKCG